MSATEFVRNGLPRPAQREQREHLVFPWAELGMDGQLVQRVVRNRRNWLDLALDATRLTDTYGTDGYAALGRNDSRSRLWRVELDRFTDATGLAVSVWHSPGSTKWNKIEHRLFTQITQPGAAVRSPDARPQYG